ncbi:MAG: DNA mismatch repair protein MutS [Bdellovibrionales bacterium]|nr:DNA mismatch repair protein MutS [Bdellovibrionales bacterium]
MSTTELNREALPPMLRLYLDYKDRYPECLLFFQVGDFYELFFDDAKIVSRILNLTLTSRDKSAQNPIPMCGVPISVVENYVGRLVRQGFSVALVSQVEGEKGKKGVERELSKIVTPGTRVLSEVCDDGDEAIILALYPQDDSVGFAYCSPSSAVVKVRQDVSLSELHAEVSRIAPIEVLLPYEVNGKNIDRRQSWVRAVEKQVAANGALKFRSLGIAKGLDESGRNLKELSGYSGLDFSSKSAVIMLIGFLDEMTVDAQLSLNRVDVDIDSGVMRIDSTTRAHLELIRNAKDGSTNLTLFDYMNRTETTSGSRLLKTYILNPLLSRDLIEERQAIVQWFTDRLELSSQITKLLSQISDIERIAARIDLETAQPRELAALRDSLSVSMEISSLIINSGQISLSKVKNWCEVLVTGEAIVQTIQEVLSESPPLNFADGGVIREGFCEELDRLRLIKSDGRSWIAKLEGDEKRRTSIGSLKIKYNGVFGYFIEVTKANLDKVPSDYIRKQTTVNSERFVTEELKAREKELQSADSDILRIEQELYSSLRKKVREYGAQLRHISAVVSEIDLLRGFAVLAEQEALVVPTIHNGTALNIVDGVHPILQRLLGSDCIANSVEFGESEHRALILTGPNMGGKSTFLRQLALIVIMAQLGSSVPAKAAEIGITDRIFTRIGASDDMTEGESTFMVEMREAALITQAATPKSLVLIDELGRGTATADGFVLARAIFEWLVEQCGARVVFATHFHELTKLSEAYSGVDNLSVGSVEIDGEIIFTHQIQRGAANRSYGLEVAKLAGLPASLISRAKELLSELDFSGQASVAGAKATGQNHNQISIFPNLEASNPRVVEKKVVIEPEDYPKLQNLVQKFRNIDINSLTPLEALNTLNELRKSSDV